MTQLENEWYQIDRIQELDSPALVIYLDRVKENIRLAIEMTGDPERLRPHIKTHKTKEAALLLKQAGITKFKCATIAEADILGMIAAPDVLLAYQPVGPKSDRFISIIKDYPQTKFSCLVDNFETAEALARDAIKNYLEISVFIDINAGMNRTGIKPGMEAVSLFIYCEQLKGINPIGLHVYDGNVHDPDLEIRKQKSKVIYAEIESMKKELQKKINRQIKVIAGGTPTFPIYAINKNVECSPGTFIYWDAGYMQSFTEQAFLPAALVVSRIISLPNDKTICIDLGHKSIAAENILAKRVVFLNAPYLEPVSQSEEHMVLKTTANHSFKPGDVLYGLPFHICPTCALYERASIIRNRRIVGEWKIAARDRLIEH